MGYIYIYISLGGINKDKLRENGNYHLGTYA